MVRVYDVDEPYAYYVAVPFIQLCCVLRSCRLRRAGYLV